MRSKRRRIDLQNFILCLNQSFQSSGVPPAPFKRSPRFLYCAKSDGRFVNRNYEGIRFFGRPMAAPTIYSDMSVALPYLLFLHYYLLLNYKPLRHFLTKMPPPLNGRLIEYLNSAKIQTVRRPPEGAVTE